MLILLTTVSSTTLTNGVKSHSVKLPLRVTYHDVGDHTVIWWNDNNVALSFVSPSSCWLPLMIVLLWPWQFGSNNSVKLPLRKTPTKICCSGLKSLGYRLSDKFHVINGFQSNSANTIATSFEQDPIRYIVAATHAHLTHIPQLERMFLGCQSIVIVVPRLLSPWVWNSRRTTASCLPSIV